MKLLVATTNQGKVRELVTALDGLGVEVLSLADAGLTEVPEPEETGSTFTENALLKALYYFERSGITSVADDSGLEVNILGGRPGLYSARYGSNDQERIAKLLQEMDHVPLAERGARFVCAIALAGENLAEVFTGTCEGAIRHIPSGSNGFGFDPVFSPAGSSKTFAEMSPEEKFAISHRGEAVRALAAFLALPT